MSHVFRLCWLLLPALLQLQPAAAALPGSRLPFSLVVPQARLQLAMKQALAGQQLDGSVSGNLYDGAVAYELGWHADAARAAIGLRPLANGRLRATLTMPLQLRPSFSLRKGAEKIYAKQGCAAVWSSIDLSLDLSIEAQALKLGGVQTGLTIPRSYGCAFQRNLLGHLRNIFTQDTEYRVDVVPLMSDGANRHLRAMAAPLNGAIAALLQGTALSERLKQRLSRPLWVATGLYLDTAVDGLELSALSLQAAGLRLQGSVRLRSRFRFGESAAQQQLPQALAEAYSDGFQLGFELLIPRADGGGDSGALAPLSQPAYRFAPLADHPGTAVLERYQDQHSETVVWLRAEQAEPPARILPMEGAIEGVLAEIVAWLGANPGIRSAGNEAVDRLRDEVQRFAALVAHFQRARDLPLSGIGTLRLSGVQADLQWLSLQPDAVRAGVLLRGNAEVLIEL